MQNNTTIWVKRLTIFAAAVFCFSMLVPEGFGQGTRRKRKPAPATSSIVPVTTGDAQIISRASDFPDVDPLKLQKIDESKPAEPVFDPTENSKALDDLRSRIAGLETTKKGDSDEKQKRLLLNLDILNRAEQRSESLRKQLFDMMERENTIRTRLDMIETQIRPEAIDRELAFVGSLRPEDLRAIKKKQLEVERTNLQTMLSEVQKTKITLDQNLQRSDALVEKLRLKFEKEIDDALMADPIKPF